MSKLYGIFLPGFVNPCHCGGRCVSAVAESFSRQLQLAKRQRVRTGIRPVESQFGGTCWDFSSCANIEAKYKLTRNDPTFNPDVSEQEVCWEQYMGTHERGLGHCRAGLLHDSRRGFDDRMPLSIL